MLKFGNIQANNNIISTDIITQPLTLEFSSDSDSLNSILLYNLDYPNPAPYNSGSPYLHWLVVNAKGSDVSTGTTLIEYLPPFVNSEVNNFRVDIYKQSGPISERERSVRKNFKLSKYIQDHNLKLVDSISFKVGNVVPTRTTAESMRKSVTTNYFKPDTKIDEDKKKWCRCVLKVAGKQRGACNVDKAWFETRDGQRCYNPYRVCAASVGTTYRKCSEHYDFENFSDEDLITYAQLHQNSKDGIDIIIPEPYNRNTMLGNIKTWKDLKGKK